MNADNSSSHAPSLASSTPAVRERENSNSSLLGIVKAQIVFLLSTLTEENFERNQIEIRSLSETHGIETYLHFIRRLIVASQARLSPTSTVSPYELAPSLTFRLLVQETQRLARDPFLADRFREGIDKGDGEVFRQFDLVKFCDRVGLRPLERLILASSILGAVGVRKELVNQANTIIRVDWNNAIMSLCSHPSFDHADLTPSQVAKLLSNLLSDPPPDAPVLDSQQRLELIAAAQTKCGPELMPPILRQIFPTLSLPPGTSLVQALVQLGSELTGDPETVRALLSRFGITETNPPQTTQVAEMVTSLAKLAVEGNKLCDVGALVRTLSSFRSPINWPSVVRAFDRPERTGVDTATLKLLIAILLNAPRMDGEHAVSGFWTPWNNTQWQVRLLDALLSLPNDTFNFVSLPGRRIVTVDDVATASPTIKALAANVQGHTWNSLDLIEILVRLGDEENPDLRNLVRDVLDKAVKISAELVHMGLLQVPVSVRISSSGLQFTEAIWQKPWGATQHEYSEKLLGMFLAGHPNHQLVFMRIWQIDPTYLTDAFRQFYAMSGLNITRILDVAQDLKVRL
ncbi:hypothetical protein FRC03_007397 [Tulasnella sp. 419]|nr:hypothetical protein FRC02_010687 [Tulasnella sp. 418]KAG8959853.1 hypothetical protein FRC03_007397 [Tulasnella sp. 419]